jgi:hypothetical protein
MLGNAGDPVAESGFLKSDDDQPPPPEAEREIAGWSGGRGEVGVDGCEGKIATPQRAQHILWVFGIFPGIIEDVIDVPE